MHLVSAANLLDCVKRSLSGTLRLQDYFLVLLLQLTLLLLACFAGRESEGCEQ
jgi:hypothetical protein